MGETFHIEDFPPVPESAWRAVVERDLKGADFERKLVRKALDGLRTEPLYQGTSEDVAGAAGTAPWLRGASATPAPWTMAQRHDAPSVDAVLASVATDLANGVSGIHLCLDGEGTQVDVEALDGLLAACGTGWVSVEPGAHAEAVSGLLGGRGAVYRDPIGQVLRWGGSTDEAALDAAVRAAVAAPAGQRGLAVDGLVVHGAGGTDPQVLGWMLAQGVAWLRAAERVGSLDEVAERIVFRVPMGTELFQGAALLRALRGAWGAVLSQSGLDGTAFCHAEPGERLFSCRDPWVNLLRNTVAVAAAGIGGAQVITSAPFDRALGVPDALGLRVARNTHHLLLEESHLGRVLDPAGGSWFAEARTAELAQAGWAEIQHIERAGGALSHARDGLAAALEASWQAQHRDLARRKAGRVGGNLFPDDAPSLERAPRVVRTGGLPLHRLDAPWEALRDRVEAAGAPVLLVGLGTLAEHNARMTWTRNLVLAGGFAVTECAAEEAAAHVAEGCSQVVLVGSDARYLSDGLALVRTLRSAGARVATAGRPGAAEVTLREAGVTDFVFAGADVLALLTGWADDLGVTR